MTVLRSTVVWRALKSTHSVSALEMFPDFGMPHRGTGREDGKLDDCHGSMSLGAFMRMPLRRHLLGMQPLHRALGDLPLAGMFHLRAGWPALLDKGMPVTAAGHDLRHVHAALEIPGPLGHRGTDVDVALTHKHVCIDEDIAGRAEAIA